MLRVAPALAPAVLDLIEGRTERGLALVRGDAYRLVGREIEARRAFTEAARGGSWPPPTPEYEPDSDADLSGGSLTDGIAADPPAHEPTEPSNDWSADATADAADDAADPPTEGESA